MVDPSEFNLLENDPHYRKKKREIVTVKRTVVHRRTGRRANTFLSIMGKRKLLRRLFRLRYRVDRKSTIVRK